MATASSCCTPDGHCAPDGPAAAGDPAPGAVTAVYTVSGMTCGHCETAVGREISALAGVTGVAADATTGRVTVTSAAPLSEDAVRAAVDEAGYELVGPA
ncbi:heavy-metal-associated domain-containing protein [Streptomyces sp. HPF1205]|uniref:heavy-metal-associated domain-containing protein n=1 Tax=Streptomyces sp. HPF1205 TaxID=2873262 RepID=UPI001CEDE94C|nr:heavy-metal-associated domain-containing protein [Streptomyces sp. HPF1205]